MGQITTYPLRNKQDYKSKANFTLKKKKNWVCILSPYYLFYSKTIPSTLTESKKELNKNIIPKRQNITHILFVLTGKQIEIKES